MQQAAAFTTDVQMGTLIKGLPKRCGQETTTKVGTPTCCNPGEQLIPSELEEGAGDALVVPSSQGCPAGADRGREAGNASDQC